MRAPEYLRRWPERFGVIDPAVGEKVIWVHAVSVGEVQAAEPLIRALLEKYPGHTLLVTTVTPTGSAHLIKLLGNEVSHLYAPYDLPGAVARFLGRVRPRIAIVMETELWPNLFHACRRNDIPLYLVNARLSERSVAGYVRFSGLFSQTLNCVTAIAVQGKVDANRFKQLGALKDRICVTGNLKFEQRIPPSLFEKAEVLRRDWGTNRPVWIAASTHVGEDELILDVFRQVKKQFHDCLLVIVPRHPERFPEVADLCKQRGYNFIKRSDHIACDPETEIFIGNSMGDLILFYAASDVAFVGGSLVHHGGHNLLEPASLGVPVLTGPNTFNFTEITELLIDAGACIQVENTAELKDTVCSWLADANLRYEIGEKGKQVVEKNKGALESVLNMIQLHD